jgi:hypothetical protein
MKKLALAALLAPAFAFGQTFPTPIFSSVTLQNPLTGANGGTGVANSSTITLGGNLTTSGANPVTFTTTGSTNVTLPTSGTLLNGSSGATAGAAISHRCRDSPRRYRCPRAARVSLHRRAPARWS